MKLWLATSDSSVRVTASSRKKRNSIEIAADVLDVTKHGARKTRIMYGANLSYELLQEYLAALIEKGLIEKRDESGIFHLSSKGSRFLEEFNKLKRLRGMYGKKVLALNKLVSR